jgi:hypothetical protein
LDYSKFTRTILTEYMLLAGATILGIALSVIGGIYLVKAFLLQNAEQTEFKFLFFNNKESIIDFIGLILVAVILALILLWSRNVWADVPYAINKDFSRTIGIVVSQDAAGRDDVGEARGFRLRDIETGEVLNLQVFYTPIREGEIYEVMYLPNTKVGAIVRKIEGDELP